MRPGSSRQSLFLCIEIQHDRASRSPRKVTMGSIFDGPRETGGRSQGEGPAQEGAHMIQEKADNFLWFWPQFPLQSELRREGEPHVQRLSTRSRDGTRDR